MSWFPDFTPSSRPKILIVGYGTVGRAVANSLQKHYNLEIKDDPTIPIGALGSQANAAIICVDTPPNDVSGRCETRNVKRALEEVRAALGAPPLMVKSTMPPDSMGLLPDNAIYCPEFLRQDYAFTDFQNQDFMLLGGDPKNCEFWERVFGYLQNTHFVYTTPEAASWTKYMHNAFLATKVTFFHDMAERSEWLDDEHSFNEAIGILATYDKSVGKTHLRAPNAEGTYGYAGGCFPKDMAAFQFYTQSELLQGIIDHNEQQRKRSPRE